jgi:four helix bundle protein
VNKAELLARTKAFALRTLKLVDHLPRTTSGRAIGNQLVRSGTSIGANYRAACRSRSRAEFAAKLGIVAEEADETLYWLELIRDGELIPARKLTQLLSEADQLTAIFTAARRTSSRHQTSNIKPQTLSS